jgi:hypothetical protein
MLCIWCHYLRTPCTQCGDMPGILCDNMHCALCACTRCHIRPVFRGVTCTHHVYGVPICLVYGVPICLVYGVITCIHHAHGVMICLVYCVIICNEHCVIAAGIGFAFSVITCIHNVRCLPVHGVIYALYLMW